MVVSILHREYGPATDEVSVDDHVDNVCESVGGKWYRVRVHKVKAPVLDIITLQFRADLEAFGAQVQAMKLTEGQAERDRMARKEAEDRAKEYKDKAERDRMARKEAEDRAKEYEDKAERDRMARKEAEEEAERDRMARKEAEDRAKEYEDKAQQMLLEVAELKRQLQAV